MPFPWDPFQDVNASLFELDRGACHQILDRATDEDLAGTGFSCYSGTGVYGDAAYFRPPCMAKLDLTCMYPRPDLNPELPDRLSGGGGALDRLGRRFEDREEAIPSCIDLSALSPGKFPTYQHMMML